MNLIQLLVVVFVICLAGSEAARKKKAASSSSASSDPSSSSTKSISSTKSTTASSSSSSPEKKFSTILEKLQDAPVLSLSDANFTKFVTDRPRDYYAVLMFTATNPRYQCSICGRVDSNFQEIATAYHSQYNLSTVPIEQRIVFFKLEVDNARGVFGDLALETVPRFYSLPPTTIKSPKSKISDLEIDAGVFIQGVSPAFTLLEAKTGVKIRVLTDPYLVLLVLGFTSLIVALFVSYASYDFTKALLCYQSPAFWVFVSVICFGVGVSGSIFCVIRSAPLVGYNRMGSLSIFAAQGRDQYTAEGIIVALWTVICGLSYYGLFLSTKLRFPVLRHVCILLCLTCFVVFALEIFKAYTAKTMWYSLRETVPADVWKYLVSSVKKSSGLPKRLLRISEIWLFDFKDWESFQKKFEGLVVDYVKRVFQTLVAKQST